MEKLINMIYLTWCFISFFILWVFLEIAYYLVKYYFRDGIMHGIYTLQATWELYKLKIKAQEKRIKKREEVEAIVHEVEEVQIDDIPLSWKVVVSENKDKFNTVIDIGDRFPQ